MSQNVIEATHQLLGSIYLQPAEDRSRHAFVISKPQDGLRLSGLAIELHYEERALTATVLFLRKHAALHLRALSVSDVRAFLTQFVSNNFWLLAHEVFLRRTDQSLNDFLSDAAKESFAAAMAASALFVQPRELTLFPLSVLQINDAFLSDPFFLVPPLGLNAELVRNKIMQRELAPDQFPPLVDTKFRPQPAAAWLGVHAPNVETAMRVRAAVLGAIALLPHPKERYQFSGRAIIKGRCTFVPGSYSLSIGNPHTPALAQNVVITADDHIWLALLARKLQSERKVDRKHLRALEYHYRSWVPDPTRRFPTLFAALDAIYGDAGQATQAVIDAVGPVMGADYSFERLRMMLGLRASVIHGGAPNVYESSKYQDYYERYGADATRDLELIVARCLQITIFGEALNERPHTFADEIRARTGRII